MTLTGTPVPRKEDPRLLRGRGAFTDGFHARGELWARVVRSPVAHGAVRMVDVAKASRAAGVTAVVTAADLPPGLAIPVRLVLRDLPLTDYLQPVLAADMVRYVGEPLAVVVAEDAYAAEDAAELVDIDIDPLPAVLDAAAAASGGGPRLFPAGNVAADLSIGYGDAEAGFARAAHVAEAEIEIGRHTGVPLEPRALLAEPDPRTGALSITGMTKVPVFNRDVLAGMLGIDETLIHVRAIDAGGGFGVRGEFYPEDFLIPWLARTLGRPVKWAEDRAEHLVAVNHSRQQVHRISAAFDPAGRILALADDILHDNGAYCRTHGITVPELTVAMLPGPYRVPAFRGRIRVLLTNKTPCGTYRAPGRFEGTTAREQLLDMAADQLGIGRAELRRAEPARPRRAALPPAADHAGHRRGAGHRGLPGAAGRRRGGGGAAGLPRHRGGRARGRGAAAAWGSPCSWRRAASARRTPRTCWSARPARCTCTPAGPPWGRVSRPCLPRSPRMRSVSASTPCTW